MLRVIRHVVRLLTSTAWLALIADPLLAGWTLGPWKALAMLVAAVGTVVIVQCNVAAPIAHVFDAGREFERREQLRTKNSRSATPLDLFREQRWRFPEREGSGLERHLN